MKNRLELAKYFRKLGLNYGAEIGVSSGRYSEILCQSNPKLKLICVDIWKKDRIYNLATEKLKPYNATIIRESSVDAASQIPDKSLDFVFIDADHKYESVKQDLETWAKKVRRGGIVSGHDYYVFKYSGNRSVIDAVDEYAKKHNVKLQLTDWDWNAISRDDRPPCWFHFKE